MFICKKCNSTFEEPARQYDCVGYKYDMCPYCEHDEISTAVSCMQCSEPKYDDGEKYCDDCKLGVRVEFYGFLSDMQITEGWDKELLDDAIEEYLGG